MNNDKIPGVIESWLKQLEQLSSDVDKQTVAQEIKKKLNKKSRKKHKSKPWFIKLTSYLEENV